MVMLSWRVDVLGSMKISCMLSGSMTKGQERAVLGCSEDLFGRSPSLVQE